MAAERIHDNSFGAQSADHAKQNSSLGSVGKQSTHLHPVVIQHPAVGNHASGKRRRLMGGADMLVVERTSAQQGKIPIYMRIPQSHPHAPWH